LSIEGWLLGKTFDKFIMHVPVSTKVPFDVVFRSQHYSLKECNLIVDGIPDMTDIFGELAPVQAVVYHSTCHLQS